MAAGFSSTIYSPESSFPALSFSYFFFSLLPPPRPFYHINSARVYGVCNWSDTSNFSLRLRQGVPPVVLIILIPSRARPAKYLPCICSVNKHAKLFFCSARFQIAPQTCPTRISPQRSRPAAPILLNSFRCHLSIAEVWKTDPLALAYRCGVCRVGKIQTCPAWRGRSWRSVLPVEASLLFVFISCTRTYS